MLQDGGLATLLLGLLSPHDEACDASTGQCRFDITLLAERLVGTTDWLTHNDATAALRIG